MKAPSDSILYELDRIEDGLKFILQAQLGSANVKVFKKRDTDAAVTPRVELIFTATQNEGRRYLRYPTNPNAFAQPLNAWNYTIQPTVVTSRQLPKEAISHAAIIGIVRWSLQYFRLLATIDESNFPYHTITSIIESSPEESLVDAEDKDQTRLTFSGIVNIRNDAWPDLN